MIWLPLILFFLLLLAVSLVANRHLGSGSFTLRYFVGERTLNGFVLAMTLVATYGSVSSFVSGPGLAWSYGLGWVVFAAPQILAGFLLLGVAGKKLAILGRRLGAVTVVDVIRARYGTKPVARVLTTVLAVLMLIFFTTMMIGQFIGGAQIFAQAAHVDYVWGLLLFGLITIGYTAIGGYRAVALTDMVCAVLMLTGMFILGGVILAKAGGLTPLMNTIATVAPNGPDSQGVLLTPNAGGALSWPLLLSAWVLVGFGTMGLPQSQVRCLSYRQGGDLTQAMVVSTIVCGALMIGMTTLGVWIRGVMPEGSSSITSTDQVMPFFMVHELSPWLAGITLIGPLAATMSTVSSLLLAASAAVIKDLVLVAYPHWEAKAPRRLQWATRSLTASLGLLALVLAIYPWDVVAWINIFAFGGLELAFLLPVIGGLFWSRASASGALASVLVGIGSYLLISIAKIPLGGWHAIVPSCVLSGLVFIAVSLMSPHEDHPLFFPKLSSIKPPRATKK